MTKKGVKEQPIQPEIVESPENDIALKYGDCLIEIIDGEEKGKKFTTSVSSLEKYFSNELKYKVLKKNH